MDATILKCVCGGVVCFWGFLLDKGSILEMTDDQTFYFIFLQFPSINIMPFY